MTTGYAIHALETGGFGVLPTAGWREIKIDEDNIQPRVIIPERKGIERTSGAPRPSRVIANGAEGDLPIDVTPNAIGIFLALCASSSVVTTPIGATLARKHTHIFGADGPPTDKSLSSEFYRDREDGTLDLYRHRGGQATQLDFSLDGTGTLGMTVGMNYSVRDTLVIADEDTLPARTSTAPDTGFAFGFSDVQATLTPRGGASADRCLRSLKMTLPTGLKYDPRICTDAAKALTRSGTPAPTVELAMDYAHPQITKDFLSGTLYELVIVGTLATPIEGSTVPSITITVDGLQWTGQAPKIEPDGRTSQTLPANIVDDPSNANPSVVIERITTDTAV